MTTLISNSFESLGWLNINDKSEINDAAMFHKCPNKLATYVISYKLVISKLQKNTIYIQLRIEIHKNLAAANVAASIRNLWDFYKIVKITKSKYSIKLDHKEWSYRSIQ